MTFLTINGWNIPVALAGVDRSLMEIGSRARSLSGAAHVERRALKQVLKAATNQLKEMDATAVVGAILGLGQAFPYSFDDTPRLVPSAYSASGLAPTLADRLSHRIGTAGDGDTVVQSGIGAGGLGVTESKFGNGSIAVEPVTTNILDADSRDAENAPTGYSVVAGASISADTDNFMQGTTSLQVDTVAASDGAQTDAVSASSATAYAGSVYMKRDAGGGAIVVTLQLWDDVGGLAIDSDAATLTDANKWYRFRVAGTTDGSATAVHLKVKCTTAGAQLFYADCFQIEQKTASTTWFDGGPRSSGNLNYTGAWLAGEDFTIAAWLRAPTANPSANAVFAALADSAGTVLMSMNRQTGTNNVRGANTTFATSPWDDEWHHVAFVYRHNPETNESRQELYFDGSSEDTDATQLTISDIATLAIGHDSTANQLWSVASHADALIDDVVVVPYAMPAAQVAALYTFGAMSALPVVAASGDWIDNGPKNMLGKVTGQRFVEGIGIGGVWRNNAREISFLLEET